MHAWLDVKQASQHASHCRVQFGEFQDHFPETMQQQFNSPEIIQSHEGDDGALEIMQPRRCESRPKVALPQVE
jgi:hypothetical protein